MSYQTEFPDYPANDLPVIPSHWLDSSWRVDVCPFWTISPDMGVWVDYADTRRRELDGPRFIVVRLVDGMHVPTASALLETDDWRDVLAFEYRDRIGYNPFTVGPAVTVDEVAATLAEHAAIAIAVHWAARIGLGFHPDTRGADYDPPLSADDVARYDSDMATLMRAVADPYAVALEAMGDAGLLGESDDKAPDIIAKALRSAEIALEEGFNNCGQHPDSIFAQPLIDVRAAIALMEESGR